ncbi:MAG: hypothetical protein OXH65_11895 [Paracoccaceae bacterium]|nr:hypothetical protein [Paracoccaceae bacterium]
MTGRGDICIFKYVNTMGLTVFRTFRKDPNMPVASQKPQKCENANNDLFYTKICRNIRFAPQHQSNQVEIIAGYDK